VLLPGKKITEPAGVAKRAQPGMEINIKKVIFLLDKDLIID
jgi:hypothetical protein